MPSAPDGRKKRKKHWVYPSFQKNYIRQITVCAFIGALFVSCVVFSSVVVVLRSEFSDDNFERQIKTFAAVKWVGESGAFDRELLENADILRRYQKRIYSHALTGTGQAFALSLLFLLPVMMLVGMLLSHRMVGGISRIEAHLERLRKGETHETLVCRDGDQIQPIVSALSAIDRNYVRRLKKIQDSVDQIRAAARILKNENPQDVKVKLALQQQESALLQIDTVLKSASF